MPKVFVTHSTHLPDSCEASKGLLGALKRHLSKTGWEVFVDEDQDNVGQLWRPTIVDGIETADAAVLLLDEKSIDRDWVIAESLVFSFRHLVSDGQFKVIPVYVDCQQHDHPAFSRLEPFQLKEIQGIVFSAADDENECVRNVVESLGEPTPCRDVGWIHHMSIRLSRLTHANIAFAFNSHLKWSNTISCKDSVAQRAASQVLHHYSQNETLESMTEVLKCLADQTLTDESKRVVELYMTQWIENETAQALISACDVHRDNVPIFVFKSNNPKHRTCLVKRLEQEATGLTCCSIDDTSLMTTTDVAEYIRERIARAVAPNEDYIHDDGTPMSAIETIREHSGRQHRRVLCFLPESCAADKVIEQLNPLRANVVFLITICVGTNVSVQNVRPLKPELDAKRVNDYSFVANALAHPGANQTAG